MKSTRLALCALLLAALAACQSQSPVAPTSSNGAPPGAAIADRDGDDVEYRDDDRYDDDDDRGGNRDRRKISVSITASPASIQNGQSATLSWKTTNATWVMLDRVRVSLNGSKSVSPSATTTYTLMAGNSRSRRVATATVTVGGAPTANKPSASLSAAPSAIQSGQSSTLTWSSTNATSVTLDGAPVALSGTQSVSPAATKTYSLVATGAGGSTTASATITVTATPPPPSPSKPTASLSANPASIQSGQSSTLSWSTTGATSVTLDGAAVALNGSQSVSPTATKSYALVATGAGGSTTASATITVTAAPPPPPPVGLTYTKDIAPIMAASCTRCHAELTSYSGVMQYVTPGSASSTLINETQAGGSMNRYLSGNTAAAEAIRAWIVTYNAKQ